MGRSNKYSTQNNQTMKKISVLVMIMALAVTAFAKNVSVGENTEFKVLKMAENGKYKLVYVSESESAVSIKIFAEDGELVAADNIKNRTSFAKTYDFEKLSSGTYTFEIANEEGVGKEVISYDPLAQKLNLRVSSIDDDKFKVVVAGINPSKAVTIKIYNDDGTLLKKDILKASRDFSRIYDVSHIKSSSFTFTASSGKESALKIKESR
jgi:flagellar hook assembly protein FlgD